MEPHRNSPYVARNGGMRPYAGKDQGFASGAGALACIGTRARRGRGHGEELPVKEIAAAPRQSSAVGYAWGVCL